MARTVKIVLGVTGAWCLTAILSAAGSSTVADAAMQGDREAARALLQKGADINARESARGETALMFAAANGRTDVIRLLTARGADVKATTKVVDLSSFAKEEQERFAQFQQGGGRGAAGRGAAAEATETKPAE